MNWWMANPWASYWWQPSDWFGAGGGTAPEGGDFEYRTYAVRVGRR
jgi:hypothetical protein